MCLCQLPPSCDLLLSLSKVRGAEAGMETADDLHMVIVFQG